MSSGFGKIFRLTTFGESHGSAVGGIIEGVPSGVIIDLSKVQTELDRRRPGQSEIVTQRQEEDTVEFLSGIYDGMTTGTPIGFMIRNKDSRSKDYDHLKQAYRPSHADFTYDKKYGIRDPRGGGRSSARETTCRVVAGAIAKQILGSLGVQIIAYVDQVGEIGITGDIDLSQIEKNPVRCPNQDDARRMEEAIQKVRKSGDTVGGCITCEILGAPVGLGEPVFDKLHAILGQAMLSINAVKGFEYGSGFAGSRMKGSEHNDLFTGEGTTATNNSGGIQGGISNGMPIHMRVAFKPVSTLMKDQKSIDSEGNEVIIEGKGRHDPCVVPRAVPIVEAMAAITLLDFYLRNKTVRL